MNVVIANPVYEGKVVGINDGDTFTVLTSAKKQIKVRLAEIDTLKKAQPSGNRAQQAFSNLAFDKQKWMLSET